MDVKVDVKFENNIAKVQDELDRVSIAYLNEVSGMLLSQVQSNGKRKSGQTVGSFQTYVDEGTKTAYIGSNYENAIWEEYGTGEFALNGDGRKGGWRYKDEQGNWHFTFGKRPRRMLFNAFNSLKGVIQKSAEERFRGIGKG